MKTFAIAAIAIAAAGVSGRAEARAIDLSRATCAEYATLPPLEREQIVLWLAGYYAGSAQRPVLDTEPLESAVGALEELCAKTPATPLIGAETRPLLFRQPTP